MNPPIHTLEAITHQVTGSICKKKTIKLHLTILKSYYVRLQYTSLYKIIRCITISILILRFLTVFKVEPREVSYHQSHPLSDQLEIKLYLNIPDIFKLVLNHCRRYHPF